MNLAFIDGQNVKLGTANARPSWSIDLQKFRVYLRDKYDAREAYYFVGAFNPKLKKLYESLRNADYVVIFREHAETALSKKKGNVDTDIVFEAMKRVADRYKFGKIVLVSGDGDYWKMVNYLIEKGKFAKLLAPSHKNASSLYRRFSDTYRDFLDNPDIKKKIIYKK